jgi:hypothetical protein
MEFQIFVFNMLCLAGIVVAFIAESLIPINEQFCVCMGNICDARIVESLGLGWPAFYVRYQFCAPACPQYRGVWLRTKSFEAWEDADEAARRMQGNQRTVMLKTEFRLLLDSFIALCLLSMLLNAVLRHALGIRMERIRFIRP